MLPTPLYPNHNHLSWRRSCLKVFMFGFLTEQPNSNPHFLNRLIKLLNHFISIEPPKKIKDFESHHIVPKSWKPEWDKVPENHLKVPAKAHYIIHHLMWKAFPKNHQMKWAFWYLSGKQNKTVKSLQRNLSHSIESKQKISKAKMRKEQE